MPVQPAAESLHQETFACRGFDCFPTAGDLMNVQAPQKGCQWAVQYMTEVP